MFINTNLLFFTIIGDPVLTAIPAESILNKEVTLICQFERVVQGSLFTFPNKSRCALEFCRKPPCSDIFNCSENTMFEITMNANASWNKQNFTCQEAFGGNKSNSLTMTVKGKIIITGVENVLILLIEKYL